MIINERYNDKEALELKKNYNHFLDKQNDIMKNTQCRFDKVLGDILGNDSVSTDQKTELKIFEPNICIY